MRERRADATRLPGADFATDDRRYGTYGHDWRAVPPMAWLDLLAQQETLAEAHTPPSPANSAWAVLSYDEFALAAQEALRCVTRPDALRDNPLLQSRHVFEIKLNLDRE